MLVCAVVWVVCVFCVALLSYVDVDVGVDVNVDVDVNVSVWNEEWEEFTPD